MISYARGSIAFEPLYGRSVVAMKNTNKAIIVVSKMVRSPCTHKLSILNRYDPEIETAAPMRTTAHRAPAAALKWFRKDSAYGATDGLNSIATLVTRGAISLSNSS